MGACSSVKTVPVDIGKTLPKLQMPVVQTAISEWNFVVREKGKPFIVDAAIVKNCPHLINGNNIRKKHHVSRKEVNKYLKKQDDSFKNNPFADALAKLKQKD